MILYKIASTYNKVQNFSLNMTKQIKSADKVLCNNSPNEQPSVFGFGRNDRDQRVALFTIEFFCFLRTITFK